MTVGDVGLVRCALIDESKVEACVGILRALGISIAGVRETVLFRALCRDGLRAYPLVCVLATSGDFPAGIVLAIVDYAVYWKRFAVRHPLIGLRILSRRALNLASARRKRVSGQDPAPTVDNAEKCFASWSESNRHIAKILFIGVLPAFQRQGIGRELYKSLLSFLKQIGVQRVDARIAPDNLPSIRLHQELGWSVFRDSRGFFATIALQPPSTPC